MISANDKKFNSPSACTEKMPRILTQRECEVLAWISAGKSNSEIAIIMGISPWTVKIHVANMYKKMNVCSRGQAVAKAISLQLIEIGS